MTKSDLVKRLSRQFPGISVIESREMVDLFLAAMKEGLNSGDTVELRDFGVLSIRNMQNTRKARNPRTGEKVMVDARRVVYFKQGRI